VDKPLKSVTHGQCYARPTVTFPAAEHYRRLTGTRLYCLATEAHVCEQLIQGCYSKDEGRDLNPRPCESHVQRLRVDFRVVKIDPLCFQAGRRKRRPNLALVFRVYFYTVRRKKEPIFFYVLLLQYSTETVEFFQIYQGTYKLQFCYLILACVKNFAYSELETNEIETINTSR